MCLNPTQIHVLKGPKYEPLDVPCKKCWRCKEMRVNDYVGRCMAEAEYSDWSVCLTLTYADQSDNSHRVLHKEHFQKFIRALRRAGHKVRYLVVGEYGGLHGRAHFHAILFGIGKELTSYDNPQRKGVMGVLPQEERTWLDERFWPFGHVYADNLATEKSYRYVVKYLKYKQTEKTKWWFSVSKKPALGAEWFEELALMHARSLVLPTGFTYHPPGAQNSKRMYSMSGTTRREYLLKIRDWFVEQGHKDLFDRLFDRAREVVQDNFDKALKWRFLKVAEGEDVVVEPQLPEMTTYDLIRYENAQAMRNHRKRIDEAKKDAKEGKKIELRFHSSVAEIARFELEIEAAKEAHRAEKRAEAYRRRHPKPKTFAEKLAQYAAHKSRYITRASTPTFSRRVDERKE